MVAGSVSSIVSPSGICPPDEVFAPYTTIEPAVVQLILRMANENQWGHRKIEGELKKLGYRISDETIRKLLRQQHIPRFSERKSSLSWRTFLNHYRRTLLACDFFTVETIYLQTLHVFFFIELSTRRVYLMGITPHPTQPWVTQQARHLIWKTEATTFTHLIRDNDGKYGTSFDAVFKSEGIEVVQTPFRAPHANAYAERWVRSVREECLDQLIILNQRHLAYVLREYERYFNTARLHQGIGQQIPDPPLTRNLTVVRKVERRDILGALSTITFMRRNHESFGLDFLPLREQRCWRAIFSRWKPFGYKPCMCFSLLRLLPGTSM